MIDRRTILVALAALGAAAGASAAEPAGLDPAAARRIGQAWLAAHPGVVDRRALQAELMPSGRWDGASLQRLRARVARDFRQGRVFIHRGWRLSDTEGRLFALLAL